MNRSGNWFRRIMSKISASLRHFMTGRYGGDKLNMLLLGVGAGSCILSLFLRPPVSLVFTLISYVFMFWALFRSLSRNTYKRRAENNAYLTLRYNMTRKLSGLKQRMQQKKYYRFYKCPKCGITTRVPKGKGKIRITCPKCGESFVRKS